MHGRRHDHEVEPTEESSIVVIDEEEPEGLEPGQVVAGGRFVLGEVLGRGGLAIVFEAYDRQRNRVVAS